MQLKLIAFLAVIVLCSIGTMAIASFAFSSPDEKGWQNAELFVTSIMVNIVMMALILKQMHEYHIDNQIRVRPWIGRSGNKTTPQNHDDLKTSEMLEITIRNHGAVPAMSIEMFTLKVTHDRQLKFDMDMDHNAFALSPSEEFGLSMDICDIEKVDSIVLDDEKVKNIINRLNIKQGILNHFEKSKNDPAMRSWFGCMIQYTDPTRKIKGAYLVLGDYDRKTKNIAAKILLTI